MSKDVVMLRADRSSIFLLSGRDIASIIFSVRTE